MDVSVPPHIGDRVTFAATDGGATFQVSEPSPSLRRIAEMCGPEDLLPHD
jgi:hypothetical protein